jgi:hypothetical protein
MPIEPVNEERHRLSEFYARFDRSTGRTIMSRALGGGG